MKKQSKINPAVDPSTEEKIKNAARIIFHKKGYAATRTRDIADEAGINLALLNYYFRSKEKLFDIIMIESLYGFRQNIVSFLNDEKTTLETKIETLVSSYIDLLINQPDIPLFILSEIRNNPEALILKMNQKEILSNSYFIKQFQQEVKEGKIAPIPPLHFIMNLIGMIVFPFVGRPILSSVGGLKQDDFNKLMEQRKILIPKWLKAISKVK
ncbi:MAG TPA: TetR/AcrR family transcriptional regulator [Bacteroidia bacterium]|jgi:AcrR family transcriptional regulator|nr:TetR/AcrR family transcriptional regulator [Bacteroidia bacterium]